MEPATRILRIPPTSFLKSCVICKQTHVSCTQCSRCPTYFQVMCAARAGHSMELHYLEKSGSQITKKLIYCADHRLDWFPLSTCFNSLLQSHVQSRFVKSIA
ncbi:hypothetical protein EUGRSUZ_L01330 [Eucalyptus grandis]|uniref:PHD-type domain-containing protein n=1 Tax=Eucalyptus grandis TaxID=71139 RepID=A0A058ZVK5_EUCGR|nr:hypothetical protein EUGRSUZ_L01330 [Eucalyptus grandis]